MSQTKDGMLMINSFILGIALYVWIFFDDSIRFSHREEKSTSLRSDEILPEINYNHFNEIFKRK